MNIKINPTKLKGYVNIPASKSIAHRMLICSALANGKSIIGNINYSKDIDATINAMKALGAEIFTDKNNAEINGITHTPEKSVINCNESGSTLRFIIPVATALGVKTEFHGRGRLPQRPIDIYTR